MLRQLTDLLRRAMAGEIGRRGADDHVLARETARDHAGHVLERAGADRKITTALGKIQEGIAER
ncbi:unnamed protein product, partial [marine sediment metagenome]